MSAKTEGDVTQRSPGQGRQAREDDKSEHGWFAAYTGGRYAPMGGYLILIGIFNALFAAFVLASRGRRHGLPSGFRASDILVVGVATHKLSRLVSKDFVTSPLRAPFTKAISNAGTGELNEEARGRGLRQAVGELVTCPWCVDWWVAAFLGYGLVLAPRVTRWVAAVFSAVTVADFLQLAYERAKAASGSEPA